MLLRSVSTPLLNSWTPQSKDSWSAETKSMALSASPICSLKDSVESSNKMTRALSESDLRTLSVSKKTAFHRIEEVEEVRRTNGRVFSNPGLVEEECEIGVLVGGGVYGGGGKICGGGGRGGGSDGGDGDGRSDSWDSNNYGTDVYYQKMIEANPGNPLLLGNYARFLKEVCGDLGKAEEYCGRAILANPNDGNVLSMYADLVWQNHKDSSRAESYYDQAVQAAPDDCYVLASYANFLWDAEEEEEEGKVEEMTITAATEYFHGVVPPLPPPLAAAS